MIMKMTPPKNSGRVVLLSFVVGLIIGCFIASLSFSIMPKAADMFISFPMMNSQQQFVSTAPDQVPASSPVDNDASPASRHELPASNGVHDTLRREEKDVPSVDNQAQVQKIDSSPVTDPIQRPSTVDKVGQSDFRKPLCDPSNRRCDFCDISGDVRIVGKNLSSVTLVSPSRSSDETWIVQPYARKWDRTSMKHVREVKVTSTLTGEPPCEVNHAIPVVVFSIAGYTGNYFHDFADVLVPLFQTARQFDGEVHLAAANHKGWWIMKYKSYFKKLSNYDVIDYDDDARVHCFKHVIVGLRSDNDLTIEPASSPRNYSMVDFMKFMREAYSLERDYPINLSREQKIEKPRLLIISRGRTRRFVNLEQITAMAKENGFEVVMAEADLDVAKFAKVVNSCDVMMGVHGAGLTNSVFLPSNAVLIQVVPFGKLDWIASTYFGKPAEKMKLHYIEYAISEEESTLTELYSRDDEVFKDPKAIHKRGWSNMGEIYLAKQNVKLDVKRFRPVLEKALEFLHHQNHHVEERSASSEELDRNSQFFTPNFSFWNFSLLHEF